MNFTRIQIAGLAVFALIAFAIAVIALRPANEGTQIQRSGEKAETPTDAVQIYESVSERGLYKLLIKPDQIPLPMREFHSWGVQLRGAKGDIFVPQSFRIRGGMPGHSHGLPTAPKIIPTNTQGEFRVEGVKFHMAGKWVFAFEILGPAGQDTATIEFDVHH